MPGGFAFNSDVASVAGALLVLIREEQAGPEIPGSNGPGPAQTAEESEPGFGY